MTTKCTEWPDFREIESAPSTPLFFLRSQMYLFPYFPHFFSDFDEIRYKKSTQNTVEHFRFSWNSTPERRQSALFVKGCLLGNPIDVLWACYTITGWSLREMFGYCFYRHLARAASMMWASRILVIPEAICSIPYTWFVKSVGYLEDNRQNIFTFREELERYIALFKNMIRNRPGMCNLQEDDQRGMCNHQYDG
jgi:hypothetical protein